MSREAEGMTADMADSRVLGRWNWFTICFVGAAIFSAYVFAWGFIARDLPTPAGSLLLTTLPLGLGVALFALLGSVRIMGCRGGVIEVVNLLTVKRIPLADVLSVDGRSGLRIETRSGRTVRSLAYGESLIGQTLGYPRSKETANRILQFCDQNAAFVDDPAPFVSFARAREIFIAFAMGATLIIVTLILNHL